MTNKVANTPHGFFYHENCIWRAAAMGVPGPPNCTQLGRELHGELTAERGGVDNTDGVAAGVLAATAGVLAATWLGLGLRLGLGLGLGLGGLTGGVAATAAAFAAAAESSAATAAAAAAAG